jgi:hypothetical protein
MHVALALWVSLFLGGGGGGAGFPFAWRWWGFVSMVAADC